MNLIAPQIRKFKQVHFHNSDLYIMDKYNHKFPQLTNQLYYNGALKLALIMFIFSTQTIFAENIKPNNKIASTQISNKDFEFTPNLQYIYREILQFKLATAKANLDKENPENGIKILLDDYVDMIYLLNNGSQDDYERLLKNESERLDLIENLDKNSPYHKFIRAEIKLHWVAIKFRFGNETKAAWNFLQANKLLEENTKLFPNFLPQKKSLGLIHIIIGSIPESYTWVTKLIGLHGNVKKGQTEIGMALKDSIFGTEAQFYHYYVQSYLLNFDEIKSEQLLKFVNTHQEYLSFYFLATTIFLRNNNNFQASQLIQKRPTGSIYLQMPIFNYLQGDISLQKEDYSQAIKFYDAFAKSTKSDIFLKDISLKTFYAYWLNNEEEKSLVQLKRISKVGNTLVDADKTAQRFYENFTKHKELPHKVLIKARFAFDGGFYDKSLHLLDHVKDLHNLNTKELAEYFYRKGRIYHKIKKTEQAIDFYNQSIHLSENQAWGFGASSALQCGYIYQELRNIEQARFFFKKAISYKKNENKNAIDIRAKSALREMSNQ
ncbi:tetratricopeptide repeat protein [Arcicella sp. LKC2W]|uniref:tetratricopeptide repeat protein n=1 Tax=Arcicella sp. LKC2W TaxID=2984198 RepID=UPI002B21E81B|nr:tetratricopeptide repeat protein [Arcicella sp. LKC2W]MEA5458979.1 tetratricopeptide repeat protein [Arcicella sp. LKC2W]